MKKSNKMLIGVGIIIVVILVISIITGKIIINRALDKSDVSWSFESYRDRGDYIQEKISVRNFDKLKFFGGWKVRLMQGDTYAVDISYPAHYKEVMEIEVKQGTLHLGTKRGLDAEGVRMEANIIMPSLRGVEALGGMDLGLNDFSGDELVLDISGGANIKAQGGAYERLVLDLKGGINADLRELTATNAHISIAGAANVELTMAGGELTGNFSGAGSLTYAGSVSREEIHTSGVARVRYIK